MLAYARERGMASAYARLARLHRTRAHAFGEPTPSLVWKDGGLVDIAGPWNQIGEGTSARVYGNGAIAVKLFLPKRPNSTPSPTPSPTQSPTQSKPKELTPEERKQIVQEGEMMIALKGAVPDFRGLVHDADGRVIGLAMEQYPEKKIREALTPEVQRSLLCVIERVCEKLLCVDMKPENFVVRDGDVRMIDLGTDFCMPASDLDYLTRVDICVLTFCVFLCEGDKRYTRFSRGALFDRLFDGGRPRPDVLARMKNAKSTPQGEVYWSNLSSALCVNDKHIVDMRIRNMMKGGNGEFALVLQKLADKLKELPVPPVQ